MRDSQYKRIEAEKGFLDRQTPVSQVKEHFNLEMEILCDVINFGTQVIGPAMQAKPRSLSERVLIADLFVHALAMLDSIQIMLMQGATYAAQPNLRSLFESCLYFSFILQDVDRRGRLYRVAAIRDAIKLTENCDSSTLQQRDLEELRSLLESHGDINREFEKAKKKHPNWYEPDGVGNIREVAKKVDREDEYKKFYSHLSSTTHAHVSSRHCEILKDGSLQIYGFRKLDDLQFVTMFSLALAIRLINDFTKHFCANEIQNDFAERYETQWRKYLDMRPVVYNKPPLGRQISI